MHTPGCVLHLMFEPSASAVDTSHRVDVKHVRYVNRQVNQRQLTLMNLISLSHYLHSQ